MLVVAVLVSFASLPDTSNPPLCVSSTSTSVTIVFPPAGSADLYDVLVSSLDDPEYPFLSQTANFSVVTISDLKPNTQYWFAVRAHDSSSGSDTVGWGEVSQRAACSTTQPHVLVPTGVRRWGNLESNCVGVAWDHPAIFQDTPLAQRPNDMSYQIRIHDKSSFPNDPKIVALASVGVSSPQDHLKSRICGLESGREYTVAVEVVSSDGTFRSSNALLMRTGRENAIYFEAYRISEGGARAPDFLENHDSGDLNGSVAIGTICSDRCSLFNFSNVPIVRYCVVRTTASLPDTETIDDKSFADYASCNGGEQIQTCECDNWIDRIIAHQPVEMLNKHCPKPSTLTPKSLLFTNDAPMNRMFSGPPPEWRNCSCTNSSLALSKRYTGAMGVALPLYCDTDRPGGWNESIPFGVWFSHPMPARCPHFQSPFTPDCTWSLHSASHMIYGGQLLRAGWNSTSPTREFENVQVLKNRDLFVAAFGSVDEQFAPRCCGC